MWRVVVLFAVAVLSACGASPVQSEPKTSVAASSAAPEPSETVDCLDASDVASSIVQGARSGTLTVDDARAVKSEDFSNVYFIAVKFGGYDGEDRGVWASNSLEAGGGLIMAVDGPAIEVTDWPAGIDTDAKISPTDPSVELALSCL